MEFLNKNRKVDDLSILGKICFDTLNLKTPEKPSSSDYVGVYLDSRNRELRCVEDYAAIKSFAHHSKYNYPILVMSSNSNNLLCDIDEFKKFNIIHIKIPEQPNHDAYSLFCVRELWDYIPEKFRKILFIHHDGFLIKSGWENFIESIGVDYIGAPWCHSPMVESLNPDSPICFPPVWVGNGALSYRNADCCREVSRRYSALALRERGRVDNRFPPEDLFYSYFINGSRLGRVANIKQAMKFCIDPIILSEYENRVSFGFHYPMVTNQFQHFRNYYNSL